MVSRAMASSSIYILQKPPTELKNPTTELQLGHMAFAVIPWLILPLVYVVFRQKWRARDVGFVLPRSWPMVLFALVLYGFAGTEQLFGEASDPLPLSFLLIAVYQPAFIEEFFLKSFFLFNDRTRDRKSLETQLKNNLLT